MLKKSFFPGPDDLTASPWRGSSSVSLLPPAVLGFLLAPRTLTGASRVRLSLRRLGRLGRLADRAEERRELVRDGPLQLVQQAAAAPAAVLRELLEAADRVDAEEVLVGLLVGQVELADVGLGQDGLEDVVLVRVAHDVLEDLVRVAEPAHPVVEGLQVAVHQQGVDAHTDAVLADEGDLVLHLVLDHLRGGEHERNFRDTIQLSQLKMSQPAE